MPVVGGEGQLGGVQRRKGVWVMGWQVQCVGDVCVCVCMMQVGVVQEKGA